MREAEGPFDADEPPGWRVQRQLLQRAEAELDPELVKHQGFPLAPPLRGEASKDVECVGQRRHHRRRQPLQKRVQPGALGADLPPRSEMDGGDEDRDEMQRPVHVKAGEVVTVCIGWRSDFKREDNLQQRGGGRLR